jgi:hypothetical protein
MVGNTALLDGLGDFRFGGFDLGGLGGNRDGGADAAEGKLRIQRGIFTDGEDDRFVFVFAETSAAFDGHAVSAGGYADDGVAAVVIGVGGALRASGGIFERDGGAFNAQTLGIDDRAGNGGGVYLCVRGYRET